MVHTVLKTFLFIFLFLFFSSFFIKTSSAQVQMAERMRVLIVPGHDDESWGAQYGNLKEADMNLVLATKIFDILKQDRRLETYITRDSKGYTKEFNDYYENHKEDTTFFMIDAKEKMLASVADGSFIEKPNTPHNSASEDVALRLYGFNQWINENKIDVVLHVHFNDYNRKTKWTMGSYKGFAIYVPDSQFANSAGSEKLANNIFSELRTKYITSNYVNELGGLISDQKLIALGSNNTLISTVSSVLVEYGYIYRFGNSTMRHRAYTTMARLTAKGIDNYFFNR